MAKLITPIQQMLIDTYTAAGKSTDTAVLQAKVEELYPDTKLRIYNQPGAGRGFMDEEGNLRKDVVCTLGSGPDTVVVFKNGDIEAY